MLPPPAWWWRASLNAVNIICSHVYAALIINGRQKSGEGGGGGRERVGSGSVGSYLEGAAAFSALRDRGPGIDN